MKEGKYKYSVEPDFLPGFTFELNGYANQTVLIWQKLEIVETR